MNICFFFLRTFDEHHAYVVFKKTKTISNLKLYCSDNVFSMMKYYILGCHIQNLLKTVLN